MAQATAGGAWFLAIVLVVAGAPIALALVVGMGTTGSVWPRPDLQEPGSRGERSARLARSLGRGLFAPRLWSRFGFGDPGEAAEHEPTWWPPRRLSSWWALLGGVAAAVPERVLGDFLAPLELARPRGVLTVVAGLVAGFWLCQGAAHAVRSVATEGEATPAALFEREQLGVLRAAALPSGIAAVAAGAVVVMIVRTAASRLGLALSPVLLVAIGVLVALVTAAAVATRRYTRAYLAAWREERAMRQAWEERWGVVSRAASYVPTWVVEHQVPPDSPTHVVATFAIPGGADFTIYEEAGSKLAPALGSDMVLVSPMPSVDETGRPIPGTAQFGGFTVTWSLVPMGAAPHLRPDLDDRTRNFAVRWAFTNAFKALKLGRPDLAGVTSLASPDAESSLVETRWRPAPGVTFDQIAARSSALQEKLGVPWLRIGRREVEGQPSEFVSIVFGDPSTRLRQPAAAVRRFIESLDWEAWYRASRLVGTSGNPPALLTKSLGPRGIAELEFACAEGLPVEAVKKGVPALRASSGLGYLAVEKADDASRFRVLAGKTDPLNDSYLFADYADRLLRPAVHGVAQMEWVAGIGADGEPMVYRFDEELPHLLLAGGSGMGKALAMDTPIPTPDGWSTQGELRPGDKVLDDRGDPCRVVALSEVWHDRPCYRVGFSDGTSVVADEAHEWATAEARRNGETAISTTGQMMGSLIHQGRGNHRVAGPGGVVDVVAVEAVPSVPVRCIQVDSPSHLYLAGPGMVPTHNSNVLNTALLQLCHNNGPEVLELRMAEPKNELQAFSTLEHTTRFIDGQTPGTPYENAAALLDEARSEMHRRYALMVQHPAKPKRLDEARLVATQEGPPPGMDRHPLDLPYVLVIIEECSNYLRKPGLKTFMPAWEQVSFNIEEVARLGRAAGIYLIVCTQYPTANNIQPTLKQQTRRIGLGVSSQVASFVVIDEPGLEEINVPGRGMMTHGKSYRGFRGFFLRKPSEKNPDGPDDFAEYLGMLSHVDGRVFAGAGVAASTTPPPPPPGIWADEF